MKHTIKAGLLLGAAAFLIFTQHSAKAEEAAAPAAKPPSFIEHLDKNKDGAVSKKEFLAMQGEAFGNLDKNKDGKITNDEMQDRPMETNMSEKDNADLSKIREECMAKLQQFWAERGGAPGAPGGGTPPPAAQ